MPILKLVIADDEPLARERLRMLLADQAGVEVVAEAGDGQQVLDACATLHPHAVLLDIAMPGLDGLETARRLAGSIPPTAVVFCTAYDEHALSAFEAAALDYLVKPVRPERLAAALERGDAAGFHAALERSERWLTRLWPDSPALREAVRELQSLRQAPLEIQSPLLDSSLRQLRALRDNPGTR